MSGARRSLNGCWLVLVTLACTPVTSPAPPPRPSAGPLSSAGSAPGGVTPRSDEEPVPLKYPASRRPWLGVEIEDAPAGRPGIRVVRVLRGSPAARGGLLAGDEILALGGAALGAPPDLTRALAALEVGSEVPLSVRRAGEDRMFRAVLMGQPAFEDQLRLAFVGLEAPSISGVVTFQGEASSLRELRGKVVLLEFWASWCEVCRYLAPVLGRWQRAYRPAGLEVVGLTLDPPAVAAAAASRAGMAYTLASDAEGDVTESYLATQIPAVFVIDRRGVVVDVMVGVQANRIDEVHALIGRLLDDSPHSKAPGG